MENSNERSVLIDWERLFSISWFQSEVTTTIKINKAAALTLQGRLHFHLLSMHSICQSATRRRNGLCECI